MTESRQPDRRIVHGAFAGSQKAADLRRIRRRTLNHLGIKSVRDLSGEQRLLLDLFCQAYRLIERLDPVTADGNASGNSAAFNAALTRSQKALEAFIASLGTDRQRRDQSAILAELQRYRGGVVTGIAAFAEQVLGLELRPKQREVLEAWDQQRPSVAVWCMGRRSTKTTMAAIIAVWSAFCEDLSRYLRPGEKRYVLVVATNEKQAGICLDMMRGLIANSPTLAPLLASDTDGELGLANGVVLRAMPCSARSGRGLPVSLLILDELAHYLDSDGNQSGDQVWRALSPSVAQFADDGHILALSTPNGRAGIFFELFERAASGQYPDLQLVHERTEVMNPAISREWLAREKARDPDLYAVEYDAQFAASVAIYLDPNAIARCVASGVLERPPRAGARYVFALDPAFTGDAFGLAGACLVGDVAYLDVVRQWRGSRTQPVQMAAVMAEVRDLAQQYGHARVLTDQHAAQPVIQALQALGIGVEYEPWTSESKASAFTALKQRINMQEISLLDHPPLLSELRALEIRRSQAGKPRIGAPSGQHDDLATPLAAAVAKFGRAVPPASADVAAPPGGYHAARPSVLAGPGQLRRRLRGM